MIDNIDNIRINNIRINNLRSCLGIIHSTASFIAHLYSSSSKSKAKRTAEED